MKPSDARSHFVRRSLLFAGMLILMTFQSSCNLGDKIDKILGRADDLTEKVTSSLDNAIGSLNASSANFQEILQKLINELPGEVQSTLTNEVSNLLNRAVAASGAEVRCDVDFFRVRIQQSLQRLKAKFLDQPVPTAEPQLCNVVPIAIDMNLPAERRNKLEFYGYDFDLTDIQVMLVNGTNEINVRNNLDQPTHYHMTLNLGSNGVPVGENSTRLVLRWNNRDISSIGIIQKAPDICETSFHTFQPSSISFMPPHTRGDREFAGHGPNINCNVDLVNTGNELKARVYMRAVETKSDWTTAEGSQDFILYTADPGKKIESVVSSSSGTYSFTDNNHNMDEFPGTGPVSKFSFMGDGDGNDAGFHTRVNIDFNNIRVQLKETGDCVSSSTIRMLELQGAISKVLQTRARAMKKFEFIAPQELTPVNR